MGTTLLRAVVGVAVALAVGSATALAAPPTDPPGRSGDAPGHQKGEGSHAVDPSPPGHAGAAEQQPVAPAETVAPASAPAPAQAAAPAQAPAVAQPAASSPRYVNAAGKPKVNVPPAAESAPEASVSAPGASGRHKLTICHKGHAITVDVHAAQAHVEGHGDTYAVAGAKGRVACPHSSGRPPAEATPAAPAADPPAPDQTGAADAHTVERAVAAVEAEVVETAGNAAVAPSDGAALGVSATAPEAALRGGTATAIHAGTLPFTGASLATLVLLGLGLAGGGYAVRRAARATSPGSSRRR